MPKTGGPAAVAGRRKSDGRAGQADAPLLMRVLDEIDHGLALVDARGTLRYANQLALHEMRNGDALLMAAGRLQARHTPDQAVLMAALAEAHRGRRRLLTAGPSDGAISIAVVPMGPSTEGPMAGEPLALLVFGKRHAVEGLTVDFFARTHDLTSAETAVLKALCFGRKPKDIAADQAVAISTIRSHIGSIRAKTQTASISALVNRVAVLPPITPALKSGLGDSPFEDALTASTLLAPSLPAAALKPVAPVAAGPVAANAAPAQQATWTLRAMTA